MSNHRTDGSDGGPAFPRPHSMDESGDYYLPEEAQTGMSLRDWFAGQALAGVIETSDDVDPDDFIEAVAHRAYAIADAMLAERDKK